MRAGHWLFLLGIVVSAMNAWAEPASGRLSQRATFVGMPFVWVPKGCFNVQVVKQGQYRSATSSQHLCVTGYWLGETEVTQRQWATVMGNNPAKFTNCGGYCPVEQVSWLDVQAFIARLNTTGQGVFALPDEVQWEYACRSGGKNQTYAGGDNVALVGWYGGSWKRGGTRPVAQKAPNGLGLYDMSGNVWEWVESYKDQQAEDGKLSLAMEGDKRRLNRGGSWLSVPEGLSCDRYNRLAAEGQDRVVGFRLFRFGDKQS
jgi:formylglycine-generating enzyme required for sulfatase activity